MSSSKTRKLRQIFSVQSFSWAGDNLTIVTAQPHLLYNGITVTAHNIDAAYDSVKGVVTVVDATTFTIAGTFTKGNFYQYQVDGFLPGQTGGIGSYSLPRSLAYPMVVQSYVKGTGGAAYKIQVSLDGQHWIDADGGTISHTTVNDHTAYVTILPGWTYIRPNITSVGANTNLVIITGE